MTSLWILFLLRHADYVRNFEAGGRPAGAARPIGCGWPWELPRESAEVAEALAARHAGVTWGRAPKRADAWAGLTRDWR